jgi:uncharacterized protein YuzE
MKTIKLPYKSSEEFQQLLSTLRREQSIIIRSSYNRAKDKRSQKEIRNYCSKLNNISHLDSWLLQCGVMEGLYSKTKDKVIFGSKQKFYQRLKNNISAEVFKTSRLLPLTSQGEKNYKGNRKFTLDLINNSIIFKYKHKQHFILELPRLRPNYSKELFKLQELSEQKLYCYSIKLDQTYIYISFEPFKEQSIELNDKTYIGIDLNPSNIGISIVSNDKLIKTKEYNFKTIIDKFFATKGLNSLDKKLSYLNNKLDFELSIIAKDIYGLMKQYKTKFIFIENLSFSGNAHKGKNFNRLTKLL